MVVRRPVSLVDGASLARFGAQKPFPADARERRVGVRRRMALHRRVAWHRVRRVPRASRGSPCTWRLRVLRGNRPPDRARSMGALLASGVFVEFEESFRPALPSDLARRVEWGGPP